MRILLSLLFLPVLLFASKDKPELAANLIPDSLKKNANAVVRYDQTCVEITSKEKAKLTHKFAITILNKNGAEFAENYSFYDKYTKISEFKAFCYDKDGKRTEKLSSEDIIDQAIISGYTLFDDNKIKVARFTNNQYPYTVEFESEEKYDGFIGMPWWIPIPDDNVAVEKSNFEIKSPRYYKFQIKENNIEPSEKEVTEKEATNKWHIENVKAREEEDFMPFSLSTEKYVLIAPTEFYYDKKDGNMSSWESWGRFIYENSTGLINLPLETVNKIKDLCKDKTSDTAKIKAIYKYMQSKTRYVSVQLGIGGWISFPAEQVDKYGYGDCKGLSNYMRALLNVVGIKSYCYIIHAGGEVERSMAFKDFASLGQSNHQMLCVPMANDTIWLECTSQTKPFGYIGGIGWAANRNVMLITEKGGVLAKTPNTTIDKNVCISKNTVNIDESGNIKSTTQNIYKSFRYDDISHLITESLKKQEEALLKSIPLNNFKIVKFTYSQSGERQDVIGYENFDLTAEKYANITGKRMFVSLNFINKVLNSVKKTKKRINDICLKTEYSDIDTVSFEIPTGYKVESTPENHKTETCFGSYESKVEKQKDGKILYTRLFKRNKGVFPKEKYQDFYNFYENIAKFDGDKMILIKE